MCANELFCFADDNPTIEMLERFRTRLRSIADGCKDHFCKTNLSIWSDEVMGLSGNDGVNCTWSYGVFDAT
ncbi:MAG: hypothetical protein NTV29_12395 [Planctomycetota bacterium]|nr:hypothetical protein [Planctomycetota bacterium]